MRSRFFLPSVIFEARECSCASSMFFLLVFHVSPANSLSITLLSVICWRILSKINFLSMLLNFFSTNIFLSKVLTSSIFSSASTAKHNKIKNKDKLA